MLNTAKGPLADARIRRALALAIDRQALVRDVLDGAGQPLLGYLSPNHVGADPAPQPMYDPAEAQRLLSAAGYGDGLKIQIDCPTSLPDEAEGLTTAVIRHLAAIGVAATIKLHEDSTAYAEMVRAKKIGDMCVFGSSPMSAFRLLYEKIDNRNGGAWHQGYRNTEIEALIDKALTTTNQPPGNGFTIAADGFCKQTRPGSLVTITLAAQRLRKAHKIGACAPTVCWM